jgi:hypothetical protein
MKRSMTALMGQPSPKFVHLNVVHTAPLSGNGEALALLESIFWRREETRRQHARFEKDDCEDLWPQAALKLGLANYVKASVPFSEYRTHRSGV